MYIGIDVHKDMVYAVIMKEDGRVTMETVFENNLRRIDVFFRDIPKDAVIAMESSTSSKPVYHHLLKQGYDVRMANPIKVRLIADSKEKRDRNDAYTLANLLRTNYLPESFVPTPIWEEVRTLCRYRVSLGRKITTLKNQVHALLRRNGIKFSCSDLFGRNGLRELKRVELPTADALVLSSQLKLVEDLAQEATRMEDIIASYGNRIPEVKLLMTIPGIDFYSALTILGEIGGEIGRFPDVKKLDKYAGLVPSVRQSGDIKISGHITKEGPSILRWILICVAHATLKQKQDHKLKRFYMHLIRRRKLKGVAITATAKKLLHIIYAMLMKNEKYQDANEDSTRCKLRKMELRATREAVNIDMEEVVERLSTEMPKLIHIG